MGQSMTHPLPWLAWGVATRALAGQAVSGEENLFFDVMLHPTDATNAGVQDGQPVMVRTAKGDIVCEHVVTATGNCSKPYRTSAPPTKARAGG